jgi:hypothetical protein
METNCERTSDSTGVQIFELTMDNDEDQDELNHRLRKAGEPECRATVKPVKSANSIPADMAADRKCHDVG